VLIAGASVAGGAPLAADLGRLVVADPAAERLFVYAVPGFDLLATFEDVRLDLHSGTIPLPDGRLLLVDARAGEFVVLRAGWTGTPAVEGRARIPTPTAWSAVDPGLRYFVASSFRDAPTEIAAVVDLASLRVHQRVFDMKGHDELQVVLGGDPLTLYASVTVELQTFPLADLLAGRAAAPTATAPLGRGTHGAVIAHNLNRLAVSTLAALEVVDCCPSRVGQATRRWSPPGTGPDDQCVWPAACPGARVRTHAPAAHEGSARSPQPRASSCH
jgi:hypothetical protein